MRKKGAKPLAALLALLFGAVHWQASGQNQIDLERTVQSQTRPVPIELQGYSGEILSALTFDLEVMGWEVVPPGKGSFALVGTGQGPVNGTLVDRLRGQNLFQWKASAGQARRADAHTLANHVVEKVFQQKGIARTYIVFKHQGSSRGYPEIYRADFDGHNARAVTQDRSNVAAPAWLPGEPQVFYTTYKLGSPDIVSHDLRNGKRKVVSGHPGLDTSVALSPSNGLMAMIMSKDGSPDLYVSNRDGSGLRRLTRSKAEDACPTWSPDGRQICFTSASGGGARLYLVGSRGEGMKRIPVRGVSGTLSEADWSPDGRWIAFTALMGRKFHICVVTSQGGEARVLTEGEDPSWAPNSRNIVFMRKRNGRKALSILDVPTRRVKDLATLPGINSQPAWSR